MQYYQELLLAQTVYPFLELLQAVVIFLCRSLLAVIAYEREKELGESGMWRTARGSRTMDHGDTQVHTVYTNTPDDRNLNPEIR
jgi:hypothetical protein